MKFRTNLAPSPSKEKVELQHKLITIGSCFSSNIGDKLEKLKIDCLSNPFGTIYDPLSITRLIRFAMNDKVPDDSTYVKSNGVWKNLLFHSSFSGFNKDELALKIKAAILQTKSFLDNSNWLIITFGSAYVYKYQTTAEAIANCQKLAAANFSKELISSDELYDDFSELYKNLSSSYPDLKIILTLSPVRHLRDGIVENSLSKATLRVFTERLTKSHNGIHYYPAFELLIDDLRDYRFYKSDMIHPTDQAVDYIWDHFTKTYFSSSLIEFQNTWESIRNKLAHRSFNPESQQHQLFLNRLLKQLEEIEETVNVKKEIEQVKAQILEAQ